MRFKKSIGTVLLGLMACSVAFGQDKTTGAIKGQVRVASGTPNGVTVVVRQGDRELNHDGLLLVNYEVGVRTDGSEVKIVLNPERNSQHQSEQQ